MERLFEPSYLGKGNEALSLLELNVRVKEAVGCKFPDTYWVRAETSDVRINASSGHCYLEFVEKDEVSGQTVAKARGAIWARTFQLIKPYFEKETGQSFVSGLKVLVNVSVEFHELYGYSLSVHDIDPSYTLGDMVKRRKEIVRRLQREGVFDLNRSLPFPQLLQRIAVITSPTAAGYEDFTNQLIGNPYGYAFYVKLFPAVMQGEKTEESIIAALDRIFKYIRYFDAVVIIRGGGSTSELNCFDSYALSAHCAQFPLPIITGIGHERDDTIVDLVAHTRLKTPTAVASFLIERMTHEITLLLEFQRVISDSLTERITKGKTIMQMITTKLPLIVTGIMEQHRNRLQTITARLSTLSGGLRYRQEHVDELTSRLQRSIVDVVDKRQTTIVDMSVRFYRVVDSIFEERQRTLAMSEQYIKMASPEYILQRGYTIAFKEGKIVKQSKALSVGDTFTIRFADGEKRGIII